MGTILATHGPKYFNAFHAWKPYSSLEVESNRNKRAQNLIPRQRAIYKNHWPRLQFNWSWWQLIRNVDFRFVHFSDTWHISGNRLSSGNCPFSGKSFPTVFHNVLEFLYDSFGLILSSSGQCSFDANALETLPNSCSKVILNKKITRHLRHQFYGRPGC